PEAEPRLPELACVCDCVGVAHWKLSFERFIRSMKTSSRDGAEDCQCHSPWLRHGAIAASSAALSRPETCREVPNGATMSTPAVSVSSLTSGLRLSLLTVYVVSWDVRITSSTVPCASRWP